MPLFNPASSAVTVDENGFTTIAGGGMPFKNEYEDLGNGVTRVYHIVKHPTLGEITIAFQDVASE